MVSPLLFTITMGTIPIASQVLLLSCPCARVSSNRDLLNTAQDCIQWLLESKIVATKEDAVDVGKQLVRRQSIHPMSANPFEDPLGCITFDVRRKEACMKLKIILTTFPSRR